MRRVSLLLLIALAACRSAPAPHSAQSNGFPSQLAQPAVTLSPGPLPSTFVSPGASATRSPAAPSSSGSPSARPAPFVTKGEASDATGDQGNAPDYADLLRMSIESDGTHARVTVTMDAAIADPPADGEEMAVGVDLYRSNNDQESTYQLYASGNSEGWVAFLDTPSGFVRYPGTFAVGEERIVFTVPWSSLGGLRDGYARAFMDWDRKGTVLAQSGEDHMPDATRTRY